MLFPLLLVAGGLAALAMSQSKKIAPGPKQLPAPSGPVNTTVLPPKEKATAERAIELEANPEVLEQKAHELAQSAQKAAPVVKQELQKAAAVVQQKATQIRSATQSAGQDVVRTEAQKRELPPELFKTMQRAIQSGSAELMSSTAFLLREAGFPQQALQLEAMAKAARAATPPPANTERVVPKEEGLDPKLKDAVARALQTEGDPAKLIALAATVLKAGAPKLAEQLQAKADSIKETIAAKADAAKVQAAQQQTATSVGLPQMMARVKKAEPRLPDNLVQGAALALLKADADPKIMAGLADQYANAGFTAVANLLLEHAKKLGYKPPPVAKKPPAQLLAERLTAHLRSHPRGREDRAMVRDYQAKRGLTTDGLYGPGTATDVAKLTVPMKPYYWPRVNAAQRVGKFKADLLALASQVKDPAHAQGLRAVANDPQLGTPPRA